MALSRDVVMSRDNPSRDWQGQKREGSRKGLVAGGFGSEDIISEEAEEYNSEQSDESNCGGIDSESVSSSCNDEEVTASVV